MKEQIAKLANESGFDVDKTGTFGNYSEMCRLEKFAELIVLECASRLEEDYIPEEDIIEGYNEDWDNTLRYAVTTIKDHFGVE